MISPGEYIGILPWNRVSIPALKKYLLLFDKVGIWSLTSLVNILMEPDRPIHKEWIENNIEDVEYFKTVLQWLYEADIVFDVLPKPEEKIRHLLSSGDIALQKRFRQTGIDYFTSRGAEHEAIMYEIFSTRFLAVQTSLLYNVEAIALLEGFGFSGLHEAARKSEAAKVVISAFPIPGETVPFDEILKYKSDPNSKKLNRRLRNWLRGMSNAGMSYNELSDGMKCLIDDYNDFMNLKRMQFSTAVWEIIINMPLNALENIVKLKWHKLTEPYFKIRKERITLLDAELHAPGREIALIIKTQNRYGGNA